MLLVPVDLAIVVRAWEKGRRAWPDLVVEREDFAAYLAERWPIGELHNFGPDLYLACACLHRVPSAAEAFRSRYLARVPAYLGTLARSREFIAEIQQALTEDLLVGHLGTPKLAEYRGRGSLEGFVRALAVARARAHL
jgi:RNA polymerase sigma-70 factor (ECF subfamily)